ncbi:MAG TPA: quinone oxidoreductase [Candidatus Sulfotelmatobacter sp.]|jgi:NADPH2:quinone reductase|nr:quinone oxidoreductase [Candidatus Sulfotelmatobacter sp.]
MDIKIIVRQPGGIERMAVEACPPKDPGPEEIRLRHHAIGVNFVDVYLRRGLYTLPPSAELGVEGAGIVEAVGTGVTHLKAGDRIAYAGYPVGAYSSTRLLPAGRALLLPDDIPFTLAAASMLKGLTAHMLLTVTFPVGPGSRILVHAAAGGLGSILTRWAKHLGAEVIGAVGTPQKAELALANGADQVIVGRDADLVGEIGRLTGGTGVDFIVDGIGGTTLLQSLASLSPSGLVASIGQAAGSIPEIPEHLSAKLVRPSVLSYSVDVGHYATGGNEVLKGLQSGAIKVSSRNYALFDAALAHTDLEAGRSSGSLLLIP